MKSPLSTYCNRGSQGSALKALRKNIDRIFRITMKISSDWSNQADLEPFTVSLIFTRLITLTIVIGASKKTATHDLDTSAQYLLICTVSKDGDSSRYGQVVRTTEKEHEQIYSHPDAINSYRSCQTRAYGTAHMAYILQDKGWDIAHALHQL
jgi:hypothetical protein